MKNKNKLKVWRYKNKWISLNYKSFSNNFLAEIIKVFLYEVIKYYDKQPENLQIEIFYNIKEIWMTWQKKRINFKITGKTLISKK